VNDFGVHEIKMPFKVCVLSVIFMLTNWVVSK